MRAAPLWGGALLMSCAGVEHRPVDLQLDLEGAIPPDAKQLQICVEGVGERSLGARYTGRAVFTGLPAGRAAAVTVDALDDDGALLGQWVSEEVWGYTVGEPALCDAADCTPCEASGGLSEGETWVLGVRFLGDD